MATSWSQKRRKQADHPQSGQTIVMFPMSATHNENIRYQIEIDTQIDGLRLWIVTLCFLENNAGAHFGLDHRSMNGIVAVLFESLRTRGRHDGSPLWTGAADPGN